MLFAFTMASSLTAISEKAFSMGGIPVITSRVSLLEVIGAFRQRAKAFFWIFPSGFSWDMDNFPVV